MTKQQQGPQPAPRHELGPADGMQAPAPGNPARPAQSHISGNRDAGSQVAQGHPVTPGAALDGNGSHVTMRRGAPMPAAGVELRMSAAHPENAMNTDSRGGVPSLRLEIQDAARSAVAPGYGNPSDFAQPPGAAGLAGHGYSGDYGTAMTNPTQPPFATPQRPEAPAGHTLHREPGELQAGGRPGHQTPPGWAYSTRSPGDVGPFG